MSTGSDDPDTLSKEGAGQGPSTDDVQVADVVAVSGDIAAVQDIGSDPVLDVTQDQETTAQADLSEQAGTEAVPTESAAPSQPSAEDAEVDREGEGQEEEAIVPAGVSYIICTMLHMR